MYEFGDCPQEMATSGNLILNGIKVKVFPLQTRKVHIYTATALGRGRAASLMLAVFTPGESPRYLFYSRLSGPQDQSGHKGVKKNHLDTNPDCLAHSQVHCRLNYLALNGIKPVASHDDVSGSSMPVSMLLLDLGLIFVASKQVQHTHLCRHAPPLHKTSCKGPGGLSGKVLGYKVDEPGSIPGGSVETFLRTFVLDWL